MKGIKARPKALGPYLGSRRQSFGRVASQAAVWTQSVADPRGADFGARKCG